MSDENYINFNCPHCGTALEYLEQFAGTAQPCPFCNEDVIVPQAGGGEGRALALPLETPRLVLRRLVPEDAEDLLEMLSDPDLFQFESRGAWDEDELQRWLPKALTAKLTDDQGQMTIGIVLPVEQKLIGLLGLSYYGANRQQAALSVQINTHFQRRGLATEAFAAGLVFCFREIHLHRVVAYCDTRNAATTGLLAKVGMRKEGEGRKDLFIDGQWVNTAWYAMLQEEFLRR